MENKRSQFGNRCLTNSEDVFKHNAWDNVEWNEEQENNAKQKVLENSSITFDSTQLNNFEKDAAGHWNKFYTIHQNRFFKDRHWLFTEFPELSINCNHNREESSNISDAENERVNIDSDFKKVNDAAKLLRINEKYLGENSPKKILEVGCGVGNTVFPVLETTNDPELFMYCCDFSKTAIDIVKESAAYNPDRCHAFVFDLSSDEFVAPFEESSLDIIICIFVLSALNPEKLPFAVKKLATFLKPGGIILFRDYGRYDLAQLRFKKGRCLGENFYARGDGTKCYFFTQEDIKSLMEDAGLEEIQTLVDRRLQVNRGKQLTMYRVWIQAKYRKPIVT